MTPYYQDDAVTIYHGDCMTVMQDAIEDMSIATIMTDPPYSSGARQSAQMRGRGSQRRADGPHGRWFGTDNLSAHGFSFLVRHLFVECFRICEFNAHLFSFIDWRQWPVLAGAVESAGWSLRACLVWDKCHFGMGNGFRQQAEFILHASKGKADTHRHRIRRDLRKTLTHPSPKSPLSRNIERKKPYP